MNKESLKKIQCLNGAHLKWIAMMSMLIDHANKGILLNWIIFIDEDNAFLNAFNNIFVILGRIAFPIFLFLLVEGYLHTHNKWKYLLNLIIFGVLSEVPYDMFESGAFVDWGGQNMLFTLALALLTIWAVDELLKRIASPWKKWPLVVLLTGVSAYLAAWLALDYTYYGILIPVILYLLRDRRVIGSVLSYLVIIKELWSVLGFALINLYNGKRGKFNKWVGYLFYPVHLAIIGVIRMFVLHF